MPDGVMARLWAGLLGTSPLEALAVLSSLVYVGAGRAAQPLVLGRGRRRSAHLRLAAAASG